MVNEERDEAANGAWFNTLKKRPCGCPILFGELLDCGEAHPGSPANRGDSDSDSDSDSDKGTTETKKQRFKRMASFDRWARETAWFEEWNALEHKCL